MLALVLSLALAQPRPSALAAWRYSLDSMGWTWRSATPDSETEVFTRPADGAHRLLVRIESFDGQWKSRRSVVEFDCARGRVAVREQTVYSGMNLSGFVRDEPAEGSWSPPDPVLAPVLKGACGS